MSASLDAFFRPRAVAVVGASPNPLTIGHRILENLLAYGFKGPIYPVHPKAAEVRDLRAYPGIEEVPGPVDLAHIVVKSSAVLEQVERCAAKGVKGVIVNTSGFAEVGGEGLAEERRLSARARELGIRVFGPNCQGVMNTDPAFSLYSNFTFARIKPGPVSIVAQGGGIAEVIDSELQERGVGLRMYASNGNACDVSIPEILSYFGQDDGTRVIVLHMESIADPRALLRAARELGGRTPILALKSGTTREGARAVASHTGGLVEDDSVTDLLLERAGIVRFTKTGDLVDAVKAFAWQKAPRGRRVAILTNAGSPAICAADEAVARGLSLPEPSGPTVEALRDKLFPTSSLHNPLDMMATAPSEHYGAALRALLSDPAYDAVLVSFITPFFVDCEAVARQIASVAATARLPLVANVMASPEKPEVARILEAARVPTYYFPETAAAVLAALARHGELASREEKAPTELTGIDGARARAVIERSLAHGGGMLAPAEAAELATCYGIAQPAWGLARTPDEAAQVAVELGFPVVLKAVARDLVHRSDEGAVVLGLADTRGVLAAAADLLDRFAGREPSLLVQVQAPEGTEVIIGASTNGWGGAGEVGHTILFGLGGIFVEALRDVSLGLTPVTKLEARRIVRSIRGFPILAGSRGRRGADLARLEDLILRVSRLVTDLPEVAELDLNPVIARGVGESALAVDVRVRVAAPEGSGGQAA